MARVTREKFKTENTVFDNFTNQNIYKLITQGHFEGLYSPLALGKEANVFLAQTKDNNFVIVKIYRLETCDFNKLYDYIKDDPRFMSLKKQRRKVIFAWCQREFRNLMNAREGGVKVPTPYTFLNNVLVMEMIGNDEPAPKLKDSFPKNKKKFFDLIVSEIRKLYKTGFVHGDLSHFNILNLDERPVFIDFSQCTPTSNPNSEELLRRDISVIIDFFKRHGHEEDKEKVYKKITA